MCKANQINLPNPARLLKTLRMASASLVITLLCSLPMNRALAQPCTLCPDGATDTAIGTAFSVFVVRNGVQVTLSSGAPVGACETVHFTENVQYASVGSAGGIGAGFSGGNGHLLLTRRGAITLPVPELIADVTPADMATTVVGPVSCPGAVVAKSMNASSYTITAADVTAGFLQFTFEYTNGLSQLPNPITGECLDHVDASPQRNITVAAAPTCSIAPGTLTVCDGSPASFTGTPTGTGPFTFAWRKGCPGAGAVLSTSATLSFASAKLSDAGCYELTVTDAFGCITTCQATLTVNPNPTCNITGDTPVCPGSTHTYTSAVSPSGGTVVHSWSISGSGTINGSTTGASVSVTAGASGSFTLTDNITRDGCPSQCDLTVPISPNPTCNITGDSPVCTGTTHTYTSTVSPTGGTVTHSWSISGNGTINGSTTGASVSVTAGTAGSFILTDNTTRDGCPGQCTLTVTVTPCNPQIEVFKQVVCVGSDGKCQAFSDDLKAQSSASGVRGATCPAFCYRITVRNSSPDVPLVNVTVSDPDLDLSGCTFAKNLDPGATTSCVIPIVERCTSKVNTVTAKGTSSFDSTQTATATDTATVTVLPISVACEITLFSKFDDDGNPNNNHVTLLDSGPVDFSLTVTNTGQADLSVAVVGLPCSEDSEGNPIPTAFTLPVGGSSNFVCSVEVICPNGTNITVTVTGTALASASVPCVFDSSGNAITTESSTCSASVSCAQPVTCRVTGGGTLIDGTVDVSCINVPTTISPLVVNGLTVNKITHGGQLGAPFSQMDCGAILGNPCIRGQWQHTRHYQGQGNPRDVIDMDFHSVTPKGQFDSLSCACLGCCDPITGAFIPPSVGPLIHKFALCNPDDHKVCGPQPRPSPANAIIFSGVGKLTPASDNGVDASRSEWVVFRVYIEDRSEPGGFHPKGAVEPADIYCFQAWKTGIRTAKKPDFSTISAEFRTALGQANCDFLNSLESGALPIGSLP